MRELIITRGFPGSGKSRFVETTGLTSWTLCPDQIRLQLQAPSISQDGSIGINQKASAAAWRRVFKLLEDRMCRGELTVVDATHLTRKDIEVYHPLVERFDYRMTIVDFTQTITLEQALAFNAKRNMPKRVPEKVIRNMAKRVEPLEPDFFRVVTPEVFAATWPDSGALKFDINAYERILCIGDIQGCDTVLEKALPKPLDEKTLYVFIGDYLDRGIENGEVFRRMAGLIDEPNVIGLRGNHEYHLWRWGKGLKSVSREFREQTLPQLREAGVTAREALAFERKLHTALQIDFAGKTLFLTHAGLPGLADPLQLAYLSESDLIKGGHYSDPVDQWFSDNTDDSIYQVHGHRNLQQLPVEAAPRSFNLEGRVEFGGHLRTVCFHADGRIETREYENPVYRKPSGRDGKRRNQPPRPAWVGRPVDDLDAHIEQLLESDKITSKPLASNPDILSFSFKRKVFYKGSWCDTTIKARGLFIDTMRREIASRSYDKFFNIGERPETEVNVLADNMKFPVTAYLKENGYLGIVGYDAKHDALLVTSKSTDGGEFAHWFQTLLTKALGPAKYHELKVFLRDTNSSAAFEVIDPVNDPHIIEYAEAKIVLLDIIRRAPVFEKMAYEDLLDAAKFFGLPVKEKAFVLESPAALLGWYQDVSSRSPVRSAPVEGYVLEDGDGFMTKVKLPFYAFWKRMRTQAQRAAKQPEKFTASREEVLARERGVYQTHELAQTFLEWLDNQDLSTRALPIIEIRRHFEREMKN